MSPIASVKFITAIAAVSKLCEECPDPAKNSIAEGDGWRDRLQGKMVSRTNPFQYHGANLPSKGELKQLVEDWLTDGSIDLAPDVFLAVEKETSRVLDEYAGTRAKRLAEARAEKLVSTPTNTSTATLLILRLVRPASSWTNAINLRKRTTLLGRPAK
jgi:hypothetical protein